LSKQQFYRLTLVLAIPLLIFSFWLGQQDFVFNKGQLVQCDVSENSCTFVQVPLSEIDQINNNNLLLKYGNTSPDKFLGLINFDFPISVFSPHLYEDREVNISSLVNSRTLEGNLCTIHQGLSYSCTKNPLSFTSNYGRIEFINPNDATKFNSVIENGKSHFKDYFLIQTAIGFCFFLAFLISYLIISWLIYFIIYGMKKGSIEK
jgi:hypothetical protein